MILGTIIAFKNIQVNSDIIKVKKIYNLIVYYNLMSLFTNITLISIYNKLYTKIKIYSRTDFRIF